MTIPAVKQVHKVSMPPNPNQAWLIEYEGGYVECIEPAPCTASHPPLSQQDKAIHALCAKLFELQPTKSESSKSPTVSEAMQQSVSRTTEPVPIPPRTRNLRWYHRQS